MAARRVGGGVRGVDDFEDVADETLLASWVLK